MSNNRLSLNTCVELNAENSDLFEVFDNERLGEITEYPAAKLWKQTRVKTRLIFKPEATQQQAAEQVTDLLLEQLGSQHGSVEGTDCAGVGVCQTSFEKDAPLKTAKQVAKRLGISTEHNFGFSEGCTGFVRQIEEVMNMESELPEGKHFVLLNIEKLQIDVKDKKAGPLFAHRATATSLWRGPGHEVLFAETRDVKPTKEPIKPGQYAFKYESGVTATDYYGNETPDSKVIRMNGDAAYINGQDLIWESLQEAIVRRKSLWPEFNEQPAFCIPHQPNGRMMKNLGSLGKEVGVQFVSGFETMSNVSSATVPSTVARLDDLYPEDIPAGSVLYMSVAGISVRDPENKMATGAAALVW